jgi:DNA-binding FadR family transcriptional regulator
METIERSDSYTAESKRKNRVMATQKPQEQQSKSAMRVAADALRKLTLRHSDGEFVGSELDLIEKLGVSRPTFRQVAKLLEQEQLLSIRRGVGGGFFARRPSSRGVSYMAAIFLRSRGSPHSDAIRAARPLFVECAHLAAQSISAPCRAKVEEFLKREQEVQSLGEFVRREREFAMIIAEAAGNSVLELFIQVLADFFSSFLERNAYDDHPERVESMGRLRVAVMQAIRDQDPEVARLMALRRYDNLIEWFSDGRREEYVQMPMAPDSAVYAEADSGSSAARSSEKRAPATRRAS